MGGGPPLKEHCFWTVFNILPHSTTLIIMSVKCSSSSTTQAASHKQVTRFGKKQLFLHLNTSWDSNQAKQTYNNMSHRWLGAQLLVGIMNVVSSEGKTWWRNLYQWHGMNTFYIIMSFFCFLLAMCLLIPARQISSGVVVKKNMCGVQDRGPVWTRHALEIWCALSTEQVQKQGFSSNKKKDFRFQSSNN